MYQQPWPMRGLMLDPARQTETFDYYRQLIPDLAAWGFNTLLLHLTDDQGCAVQLTQPRVLTTAGALAPGQWRDLVALAQDHALAVIPEVECLGHTGCLTRLAENAELREPPPRGGNFWSIAPLHPRSWSLLTELLRRVADVFPGTYLHLGLDEADIGGSALSQEALKTTPLWRIFGDWLNRLHEFNRSLGRQSIVWGDHLLHSPELLAMTPRDVIVLNWLYGRGHREDYEATSRTLLDAGFPVIGGPAGCWWGTLLAPHVDNLANIRDFDAVLRRLDHPHIKGTITTMWCPYRHLSGAGHPIMAFAGRIAGGAADEPLEALATEVFRAFAETRFGLTGAAGAAMADGLRLLHFRSGRTMLEFDLLTGDDAKLAARAADRDHLRRTAAAAHEAFRLAAPGVTRAPAEFAQWLATAEMLGRLTIGARPELAALAAHFRDASQGFRTYFALPSDEPAMGQSPVFWTGTDNPVEAIAARG